MKRRDHYHVYVIELSKLVLEKKRFRNANPEKRALALSLGATDFASGAEAAAAVRALLPQGVDAAIDATGTVEAFEQALDCTRRGGRTVSTSLPEATRQFHFPLSRLVAEARTVRGSYIGSCVPGRDIPAFIALYRQGRLPVDKLVSKTIGLDEINEAMDALAEASVVRQVISF